jgi:hypothetical protein
MRGIGRAFLAATLLVIAGFINIIYGIGALDSAHIFVNDTRYVFSDLNVMGWVMIALGVVQITGGLLLYTGNAFGRVIGIIGAGVGAIEALFSIGGNDPWWSVCLFFLCIYILHGIILYGDESAT